MNPQLDFVGSVKHNSSATPDDTGSQTNSIEISQSFTDELQLANGYAEIMNCRHSDTIGSQVDPIQYDPIDEKGSPSADDNKRGNQYNTVDSKQTHSVFSPDNGITKLSDNMLLSSIGSQRMDSQSDVDDTTRSGAIEEPRGQLSPVDSVDAKGECADSNISYSMQHEVARSQEDDDQPDLLENKESVKADMPEPNGQSDITDGKQTYTISLHDQISCPDVMNNTTSNEIVSQEKNKLDISDSNHSKRFDDQEVSRRAFTGSDLSDAAVRQKIKSGPNVENQSDSAHTRTQNEDDKPDLLDNHQSCTALLPGGNGESNITNSTVLNAAGSQDEKDQANNFESNKLISIDNVQKENDTSCQLLKFADYDENESSDKLDDTKGECDDSDIGRGKRHKVARSQEEDDQPDLLVNKQSFKADMPEPIGQSDITDREQTYTTSSHDQISCSDVMNDKISNEIVLQVKNKLDLSDSNHSKRSDDQEVSRRAFTGRDLSDAADRQEIKHSPNVVNQNDSANTSTHKEDDQPDLLDNHQSGTAHSPGGNGESKITNSTVLNVADSQDENDKANTLESNKPGSIDNVQEKKDTSCQLFNGADSEDNETSDVLDDTKGECDDSDIGSSRQHEVARSQEEDDQRDLLENKESCKPDMPEPNGQSDITDRKQTFTASSHDQISCSDVMNDKIPNEIILQVKNKLDRSDSNHSKRSDDQQVSRRAFAGRDLSDAADRQEIKHSPNVVNQSDSANTSTHKEDDQPELLDNHQSNTAHSPGGNGESKITHSTVLNVADLQDENDKANTLESNKLGSIDNVQEKKDTSCQLFNGADSEDNETSDFLDDTRGECDDFDIGSSKQHELARSQKEDDQRDLLENKESCKPDMPEPNGQSDITDRKQTFTASSHDQISSSDVMNSNISNEIVLQVNNKLDLCDSNHSKRSDEEEVSRRAFTGSDLSDAADEEEIKSSTNIVNQSESAHTSTQKEDDQPDLSQGVNGESDITNSIVLNVAGSQDENDQANILESNKPGSIDNVQEKKDTCCQLFNGADSEDNETSDFLDDTRGECDDFDIGSGKQHEVARSQEEDDQRDQLEKKQSCKADMPEPIGQSDITDRKQTYTASSHDQISCSDVMDNKTSHEVVFQVNNKLDLSNSNYSKRSDCQEVSRRAFTGSDLSDVADRQEIKNFPNVVNQSESAHTSTHKEDDQPDLLDNHQSCTAHSPGGNGESNITYSTVLNEAGSQDENVKAHILESNKPGSIDNVQEENYTSYQLLNSNDYKENETSDFIDDTKRQCDASDIGSSKQHEVARSQEGDDQPDLLENKQSCKADMPESNGQSNITDRKQTYTASSHDQSSCSDVMNNKTSNETVLQVNNKLDLSNSNHSKRSDCQEINRRIFTGSDLSDAARQEIKNNPNVVNQSKSAHSSTQNEDDQPDLLDNHQSCTAHSPGGNDESNITNSTVLNVAGSQDEIDQANILESNKPGSIDNVQEKKDTSCQLFDGADSEDNETSDFLDDTKGECDDFDIGSGRQHEVARSQEEDDQPDLLENKESFKADMPEPNGQSDITDRRQTYTASSHHQSSCSDVMDNTTFNEIVLQVNNRLDLLKSNLSKRSDDQEVSRRAFTGSDLSDVADRQEIKSFPNVVNQSESAHTSTHKENNQPDLLDNHQSCTAHSPGGNGESNITNSTVLNEAGSQDENDQAHILESNKPGSKDNVQEENYTNYQLLNSNDYKVNETSDFIDDTKGQCDASDIGSSKQHEVARSQEWDDQPDLFENKQFCKADMPESNGQSNITDRKQTYTTSSHDQSSCSDVMNNKTSNETVLQVNNKLDLSNNNHSKRSDCQEVNRRTFTGSDLSDVADRQEIKNSTNIVNQSESAHTSTHKENNQPDLMDNHQSCTAQSPGGNDESNITNSTVLNVAGSQDENDQANILESNKPGSIDNVQEKKDTSCQLFNGADSEDNETSGFLDDTEGECDDFDIGSDKQYEVARSQEEDDQRDLLENKESCKADMPEPNGQSDITDTKQTFAASSHDQSSCSDVMDNKTSHEVVFQVNNKLDLSDSNHSKRSDAQEVSQRDSMGSNLSDAVDKEENKYSPSIANQCDSALTTASTSSKTEDDQSDLLDNHQFCTAHSPGGNGESNITHSKVLEAAGSQVENDQANILECNQPGSTNNNQEEDDESSNTNCQLLNGADSEENETSDILDDTLLCAANAKDHHVLGQEIAVQQPGYIERRFNLAGPMNMHDSMLRMRPGKTEVTDISVVGNKNLIIQGNPEEHSDTLHAIETSTNRMTDEYEEQTTSVKEEIHGSEGRLTRVIKDEGSHIAETVTNTGQDVSGRVDETKEGVHKMQESFERKQGDLEFNIAKMKQQTADFHRDAEENASYNANKSTEAQKEAIEQSFNKTTENISKGNEKIKADVRDTKQAMLQTVTEQATVMQNEMANLTTMLTADMKQTGEGFHLLAKYINTAKEDTTGAVDCLKGSLDSLSSNQDLILGKIQALQQSFTNKMAEFEKNLKISNKKHNKRIDEVCSQIRKLHQKVGNTDKTIKELASESMVGEVKNAIIGTVWKAAKRSERSILNALEDDESEYSY